MLQINARLEQHPPRVLIWEDVRLLLHVEGQEVRCLLEMGYFCPADLAHPCNQKECLGDLLRGVAAYFPQKSLKPEPPGRCPYSIHKHCQMLCDHALDVHKNGIR